MIGWLKNILPEERQMLKDYLHYDGEDDAVLVDMSIDCIMASVVISALYQCRIT